MAAQERMDGVFTYLDGVVGSDVVLVDGLEPPDVIVRVRHQVHVQLPGHHRRRVGRHRERRRRRRHLRRRSCHREHY